MQYHVLTAAMGAAFRQLWESFWIVERSKFESNVRSITPNLAEQTDSYILKVFRQKNAIKAYM